VSNQSEWKEVILRDLCESVRYGYTAKAQDEPGGPKFLRITDIVPDLIDWVSVPYCEINPENIEKYRLQEGDIVIARTGATTGYAKWVKDPPKAVFASYLVRLRIAGEHDSRYVGFVVESDTYKQFIMTNVGGAAQPNANAQVLTSFPLLLPPLPTQRKIAAILSAYDDLIENNIRRIAVLEEMARLLYREWFVHFRFSRHEQVAMVDSELGPIPEGWDVVKFSDIGTILRQGINPREFEDEVFAHYSFPAFDTGCMPSLERGEAILSNKYLVDHDCVLLSKLNPRIPRVWLPFPDNNYRAIASTEFLVLLPKRPLTRSYLFSLCCSPEFLAGFAALTLGTSTSHQRVKPHDLLNMDTVLPPQALIDMFSDLTNPMLEVIHTLRLRNTNLRRTRDLLLPRLIRGEIDVADLEINTGGLDQ
jgi:type I restriction enzyme S subunit